MIAAIGLGANLGDCQATMRQALQRLPTQLVVPSSLYRSAPVGPIEQPSFLNAAALIQSDLRPHELLCECLRIEAEFGRVRDLRWGPRTLDLDILLVHGMQIDSGGLQVPHPQLLMRAFALLPLKEVAPGLQLPDGRRVDELALPAGDLERIRGPEWAV